MLIAYLGSLKLLKIVRLVDGANAHFARASYGTAKSIGSLATRRKNASVSAAKTISTQLW